MKISVSAQHANRRTVVVVGGGFGGLRVARDLADQAGVFVILLDRRNYHLFQPLLYQVATAGLNVADIAVPIRSQFSQNQNVEVHWAEMSRVDLNRQSVFAEEQGLEIPYDYLVLACGAQHSYFGKPEWEEFAPGLKTLEQATEIRRRILTSFESAENEPQPEVQRAWLNFVVVGGGPTGVELAGAIADISRTVLVNDFRRIDPSSARVILIEAGDRVLSSFAPDLSAKARQDLTDLGVEVLTSARVQHIDAQGVKVLHQDGRSEEILSRGVLWAAGVQAQALNLQPLPEVDRAGRIFVNTELRLPAFKNVFVIGDLAAIRMPSGEFVPGLAPAAIQEGKYVAQVILNDLKNKPVQAFHYFDKGQMATIGKNRAVVEAKSLKVTGYLAWLMWLFIHVFYLIGFKNRIAVMVQWAWSYLFSKRGARLILQKQWRLGPKTTAGEGKSIPSPGKTR